MAQFPNFPQMETNQQLGAFQQAPANFPSYQQPFPQFQQPTPSFPKIPQPPFQQPGVVPFIEQSYIENILRLNRGKVATVYMNFENSQWGSKIFKGIIEAAGKDHIILSDPNTGMRYVLLSIFLNYITFDEEINYEYPYAVPSNAPFEGTQPPIFNVPSQSIPMQPQSQVPQFVQPATPFTQQPSMPQFAQPSSPFTQIRKKDNNTK